MLTIAEVEKRFEHMHCFKIHYAEMPGGTTVIVVLDQVCEDEDIGVNVFKNELEFCENYTSYFAGDLC